MTWLENIKLADSETIIAFFLSSVQRTQNRIAITQAECALNNRITPEEAEKVIAEHKQDFYDIVLVFLGEHYGD